MHGNFLALDALDIARERSVEAERRARLLRGARPVPRTLPRRLLEVLAAWLNPQAAVGRDGVVRGSA